MRSLRPILISSLILLPLTGCGLTGWGQGPSKAEQLALARQEELRNKLVDFVTIFADEVKDAAEDIALANEDSRVRRRCILWKLRVINSARLNLQRTDDLYAYLDLWSLCLQMTDLFETGEGKDMFGAQQSIAVDTSRKLEKKLETMASDTLEPDVYTRARDEIHAFVDKYKMEASFARVTMSSQAVNAAGKESFSWLRTVTGVSTLNPFGSGLSEGAAAIQNASVSADRFTQVVAGLPEDTRWQLQLLLYDLNETEPMKQMFESVNTVADSTAMFAKTANELPSRIREETQVLIGDIDDKQANLQKTLVDVREASADLEKLSVKVEATSKGVDAMAATLDGTLQTFNETLGLLLPTPDPDAPPKPKPGEPGYSRPFDILDYAKTAEAVGVTAGELNKTLKELRSTLEDDRLGVRLDQFEESASAALRSVVWDTFLAFLALIAAFFICLFGYRKLVGSPAA